MSIVKNKHTHTGDAHMRSFYDTINTMIWLGILLVLVYLAHSMIVLGHVNVTSLLHMVGL